jgi:hypothetical protein
VDLDLFGDFRFGLETNVRDYQTILPSCQDIPYAISNKRKSCFASLKLDLHRFHTAQCFCRYREVSVTPRALEEMVSAWCGGGGKSRGTVINGEAVHKWKSAPGFKLESAW